MLVFDKVRKRCIAPPTADCDIPATTPSPDGEDDNDGGSGSRRGSSGNRGGNNENRKRFPSEGLSSPGGNGAPSNLPFDLPQGVQLLQRN
jgi:hypothetical protein